MTGSRRNNQDQYDVIQAKEEFESMLDPRTKALLDGIAELEAERDAWREAHERAVAMAKVLAEQIVYGDSDPGVVEQMMMDLGIEP